MSKLDSAVGGFVFVVALLYALGVFHVINEGHIGIYYRGGALINTWSDPGLHFMIPFITKFYEIQVTLQTDKVEKIPCGTSSGVMIHFEKIEVVNRLNKSLAYETIKNYTVEYDKTWIFNKIHHEINQFCSSHTLQQVLIDKFEVLDENLKEAIQKGCDVWAPGIQIISVRVTKPVVPQEIMKSYEQREFKKTNFLVVMEEQKIAEKLADTEKQVKRIKAETENKISEVSIKKELMLKEHYSRLAEIDNNISRIREKSISDARKYDQTKQIDINRRKLFEDNIIYEKLKSLKTVTKTYYVQNLQELYGEVDFLLEKPKKV